MPWVSFICVFVSVTGKLPNRYLMDVKIYGLRRSGLGLFEKAFFKDRHLGEIYYFLYKFVSLPVHM